MADNVVLASGALVVATAGDAQNVQTQKVIEGFLSSAGAPMSVGVAMPMPVDSPQLTELLTALLIEMRVANDLAYAFIQTEAEPLEMLRAKYKDFPVTL